jgi:Protein of unknown function (DUF3455)
MKPFVVFALIALASSAQDPSRSALPANLRAPSNRQLMFRAHAVGDQIYTCKASEGAYAWALKAPDAQLFDSDGQSLGHHFAGPTWESKDGSRVIGKLAASAASPDPDSIPWLLLAAIRHDGNGAMSQILSIQRLNTKGGKAPAAGCDNSHIDAETKVPYQADYYFYGPVK